MTADNYNPATALTGYYATRATNRPARHWAKEKLIHDLSSIGLVDFFEGPGPNPMSLSGASTAKLWLDADAGVTSTSGTFKRYSGTGSSSDEANWVTVTPGAYLQHLGGLSPVTSSEFYSTRTAAVAATISGGVTHLQTAGYAVVGDAGHGLYKKGSALTSGGFQSADGAYWDLVPDNTGTVYATQFGAKFDGTTDDTTALQALIDYLGVLATGTSGRGAVGQLPRGTCRVSTLTISNGIRLVGADDASTWLYQNTGVDDALIKIRVAHNGFNYYASGNAPADVSLKGLRLIGGNRLSGLTGNHGIDLQNAATNPILTTVQLDGVIIREFAGSGLYGSSFSGWVEGSNLDVQNCTLYGLYSNSCNDWHFHYSDFHSCGTGILLSGCSEFQFFGCNRWSNTDYATYIFQETGYGNHKFFGGMMDRNQKHGLLVDLRNTYATVHLFGETLIYNSASADDTYSDIYHQSASIGRVNVVGCFLGRTYDQQVAAAEKTRYHVEYAGSGGETIIDAGTVFYAGAFSASHIRSTCAFQGGLTSVGDLLVGSLGGSARAMRLSGGAGSVRSIEIETGGVDRWLMLASSTAESGSNVGSDFAINRYADDGSFLGTPFSISRSTGRTTLTSLSLTLSDYANDAAAAAGSVPVGGFYRNGSVVQVRVT